MSVTSGRTFSLLPMLGHTKGKRSPVTCALKCDNACSGEVCNTSTNSYFRDIASATMSRRAALGFGAAGALAVVLGNAVTSAGTAVADGGPGLAAAAKDGFGASKLKFSAIAPVDAAVDKLTVPAGFTWQPVIRWGDPLFNDSPAFDVDHQSAAAQARQFGYNNDYTDILPIDGSKDRRAVLFTNHEYTNENIMLPAGFDAAETRAIGRAAHGLTRGRAGAEEQEQALELRQGRRTEPPLPDRHHLRARRPRRRIRPAEDRRRSLRPGRQGHPGQLLRRHHPVGHHPLRRGELQRLLRRARAPPTPTSATA